MARTDARNVFICASVAIASFLLVGPWVELPFDDDWSYAFSVQQLLHTGKLQYNGWSAPTLISQVYWAALLAKLFGFSLTLLRFSTLPMAVGAVILCYLLARQAGLTTSGALFAALTLALSPLFLPLATSFMTDVPALCWILLGLYALARAADQSAKPSQACAWIGLAILAVLIGGSARQSVWLAGLCGLPYLAWRRRRDHAVAGAAGFGLAIVIAAAAITLHWFHRQPDIMGEPTLPRFIASSAANPAVTSHALLQLYQTTMLLTLPAALAAAPLAIIRILSSRRIMISAALALAIVVIAVGLNPSAWIEPYCGNILDVHGILGSFELSGPRPRMRPEAISLALSLGVILASVMFLTYAFAWIAKVPQGLENRPAISLLLLFGVIYLAAVLIRAGEAPMIDRYVLPLIPATTIPVLLAAKSRARLAWILLALYGICAIASTQDVLALAKARIAAVHRLEDSGVKPTQIAAGLEYDMWTQLQTQGRINDPRTTNRTFPYDPRQGIAPALNCLYRVEFQPTDQTIPTRFGSIEYISWLPPIHRRIFIDRFTNPYWLESHASDREKPRWFEDLPR